LSGIDKTGNHFFERVEPKRMLVHAGNEGEFFAAGFGEGFAGANADFFEGFKAVGDKSRTDNKEFFDAPLSEFGEFEVGVRLQPWVASEPGLEGDGIFLFREASFLHESRDRFKALSAIAGGVGRACSFATVLGSQTMAAGRIGFAELAFGQAVETEQEVVEALVQIILRAGDESVDVIGVVEVRRLDLDAHVRRDSRSDFFDTDDGGLETGHGVVREQRNEE
jgi:hypothetical protein